MSTPECIAKRHLYLSQIDSSSPISRQTRIYHRSLSLLGFILETPCSRTNCDRYLVLYDNFTALYHGSVDFHRCVCQDFSRHLSNLDYTELRSFYQHAFEHCNGLKASHLVPGSVISVRKFGTQSHFVRIIDEDCSLIKICFFERKSQAEIWIHRQSPMIETRSTFPLSNNSRLSLPSLPANVVDQSRFRKRKTTSQNVNEGTY